MPNGLLTLALRFESRADDDPRPEDVAAVLQDIEALYRVAPTAAALGVPIVGLLAEYYELRADALVAATFASDPAEYEYEWSRFRRRYGRRVLPPDLLFPYLGVERRLRAARLSPPEHALRLRQLSLGSPLDLLAHIPPEYWSGGGLLLFLAALERRFNMVERIRTERAQLRAERAEAEVREERARRELAGLGAAETPLQLTEGELRRSQHDGEHSDQPPSA